MTEIFEHVEKNNIEFISLQFSDLLGVVKEVIIPIKSLEDALNYGIWFDGSSIEGFARVHESDLFLKPDQSTYALIPWNTDNGKTARFICDIYNADGTPFQRDPRFILKKALKEAKKMKYSYNVGPEIEFYLFKNDSSNKTIPIDRRGYFDMSSDAGYVLINKIINYLNNFGITVETSHHEVGKGQYEIDFTYGDALIIADQLSTLKYVVKKIAQQHNIYATFIPKPIMNEAGSGMHIHQSLFDETNKINLFYDEQDKYKLSSLAYNFIAGQINYVKQLCAILCPTVNSYKRLVSGFEAPVYISWGSMNRSALIRTPSWFKTRASSARIELRCPDPTCNPYLAFAAALTTGLKGIKSNIKPPEPIEENVYEFESETLSRKGIDTLPTSLHEALNEMEKSTILKEMLGESLFSRYLEIKTKEWDTFKMQVTPWEIDTYISKY